MSNPIKGILLAGGKGTRLYPLSEIISKQLQPIYNKPMIYYSLTTMIMAGIREILIISTPRDLPHFQQLLQDGRQWGLALSYREQAAPRGIAEALALGEEHAGQAPVFLMLGDNIIYGRLDFLRTAINENPEGGATVFAYQVRNASAYGVVEFGESYRALSLEEKPERPRSNWAVPGMYLYSPGVAQRVRELKPSSRGELEITDLNRTYLEQNLLRVRPMGRGIAWFDAGRPESLLEAGNFVHAIESRQGLSIGCPEEAAFNRGFLSRDDLVGLIERMPVSPYRNSLERVAR